MCFQEALTTMQELENSFTKPKTLVTWIVNNKWGTTLKTFYIATMYNETGNCIFLGTCCGEAEIDFCT